MKNGILELFDDLIYAHKNIEDVVSANLVKVIDGKEIELQTRKIGDLMDFLDFDYLDGCSENILFGIITFTDGSYLEREHEDGYESWIYKDVIA